MKTKVILEAGYEPAMLGISLSWASNIQRAKEIAPNLAHKQGGHNKFLEMIEIWIDIEFPRFVWQEFDTYRVGITKQSESTMHTIAKSYLTNDNFEYPIYPATLGQLNASIDTYKVLKEEELFLAIKNELPEGFIQRRIVKTNYKTLQNIYHQRIKHKLPQWKTFLSKTLSEIEHPEFIVKPVDIKNI